MTRRTNGMLIWSMIRLLNTGKRIHSHHDWYDHSIQYLIIRIQTIAIPSPTNTSRLYRKRIATSTLKRHRIRRTVELVAALGTRADLHRRRLRLPPLQELQSLHTQRVVGNVHQTVIMRRHPSLERGRNSYQFCDRWKNSRRLLHTPWSKGL